MKPQFSIVQQFPVYDVRDDVCGSETVRHPYTCYTEAYARKKAATLAEYGAWATVWVDGLPLKIAEQDLDIDDEIPW